MPLSSDSGYLSLRRALLQAPYDTVSGDLGHKVAYLQ